MALRGEFTQEVQDFMEDFLGRPATRAELRLLPYLHHVMLNNQMLDPAKINSEERAVMAKLRADGHIEGGASGMSVTREFWTFLNDVLWLAYVSYEDR